MSKLTALFIDAAAENVDALPKRLADLGVRYDKAREAEFVGHLRSSTRGTTASLVRDRPDPGHPRGVPADLRDEPPPAVAFRAAGQAGDRHARLGRGRAVPDFNVFRGGEAVRGADASLLAGKARAGRTKRGAGPGRACCVSPHQIHDVLESFRDGQVEVRLARDELDLVLRNLDVGFHRLVIALVVAAGLIGSSFLAAAATGPGCGRWPASASRCRSGSAFG